MTLLVYYYRIVYTAFSYTRDRYLMMAGPEKERTMTLTELLLTLHTRGALPPVGCCQLPTIFALECLGVC
jgi:hypothetical protein